MITANKNQEAVKMFQFNASKFPNEIFRISIGLGKGYKATGNNKKAIKYWKIALKNIPETIDYQYYLPRYEKELEELKASID